MPRSHLFRLLTCLIVLAAISGPVLGLPQGVAPTPAQARPRAERTALSSIQEWLIGEWIREVCRDDKGDLCRGLISSEPQATDAGCIIDPHGNTCPH